MKNVTVPSWAYMRAWITVANEEKDNGCEPEWSLDCGRRLDFDGPLIRVSSRFFPPAESDPGWNGIVNICFFDDRITFKSFECNTLEELKREVEGYKKKIASEMLLRITTKNEHNT